MCRSTVDIQSATAENRRGKRKKKEKIKKKEEEIRKKTTAAKYNGLPYLAATGKLCCILSYVVYSNTLVIRYEVERNTHTTLYATFIYRRLLKSLFLRLYIYFSLYYLSIFACMLLYKHRHRCPSHRIELTICCRRFSISIGRHLRRTRTQFDRRHLLLTSHLEHAV